MISNRDLKIGLVFDDQMMSYHHLWVPEYPECPDRLRIPLEKCHCLGLIKRCHSIQARRAAKEEVLRIHSEEYFSLVEKSMYMNNQELKNLSEIFDGVYFHPESFNAAMIAAGCAIEAVDRVLNKEVQSSFALIRPPGHHASRDEANGYCYFNNVALAASHALEHSDVRKILIIDWDVHHGQGTQSFFYDDPRVLFFSCHRYEHGKFWPNLRKSDYDFVGKGEGRGYNVNVPLNETGLKDGDYMAIFQQILMPIAFEYQPDLVLVSCGFDAAVGDPESLNHVTPECFSHLVHLVKQICKMTCFIFEGGYCLKSLSQCLVMTLKTLLGDPPGQLIPLSPPSEETIASILNSIRVMRPFWKCFQYQLDEDNAIEQLVGDVPKKDIMFTDISGPNLIYDISTFEKMSTEDSKKFDKEIEALVENAVLVSPPNRTCLAYDDLMLNHKQITGHHPEQPERLKRVMQKLKEMKLLERCSMVQSRKATVEELSMIHSPEYIDKLSYWSLLSSEKLDEMSQSDLFMVRSVYINKPSYDCAVMAAGCTLSILDDVASGKSQNGFALVRPPGHHATRDQANGFCFFNTIAIAAKYCQKHYNMKRILILDWDVHHGNGTQEAFYSDPSVLVVSIHRRDAGNFYPLGDDNSCQRVGAEEGVGFNINIPWPKKHQGDAEYMAAFQQIIMPVAYEFGPDLVLVSAGFDAALGDPLGGCSLSPEMYGHMTYMLSSLAGGRLVLVLEGGYNLNVVAASVASCVSILLGDPLPTLSLSTVNEKAAKVIREVINIQQNYWKSLAFGVAMPTRKNTLEWLEEQEKVWESVEFKKTSKKDDVRRDENCVKQQLTPDTNSSASTDIDGVQSQAQGSDKQKISLVDDQLVDVFSGLAFGEDTLQLHAVQPLPWCPHLESIKVSFTGSMDTNSPCFECGDSLENWICLSCLQVYCSRFRNSHMVDHNEKTGHPLVLSFSDLSVWCYECQAYVDNQLLRPFRDAAHQNKFHCPLP